MLDTKSPLQSLAINASLIGLVVQILAVFGIQIAPETARQIGASISSIITGVMFLLAIWGRWRATTKIGTSDPTVLRAPPVAALAVLVVALLLSGCDGARPLSAGASAPVGASPTDSPKLVVAADRAAVVVEAASVGLDAATERAIASGQLTPAEATAARNRADQVRSAVEVARGIVAVLGAGSAQDRIMAALDLAATAQDALAAHVTTR